jgi:hypothetical protein
MKRIYHDYRRWEDFKNGMWQLPPSNQKESLIQSAYSFTSDHIKYGKAMMRVIARWKFSCEHNLTDKSLNRRAWIGHAACSLELKLPESVVRAAWKILTDEQRCLANAEADKAICAWFNKKDTQLSIW